MFGASGQLTQIKKFQRGLNPRKELNLDKWTTNKIGQIAVFTAREKGGKVCVAQGRIGITHL